MVRVKDKDASLKFYQEVMGMTLLRTSENKDAGFNLYFLGYGSPPSGETANGVNPTAKREGLLELTWNYGSEKEEGPVYTDGNKEPQGGHSRFTPQESLLIKVLTFHVKVSATLLLQWTTSRLLASALMTTV